MSKLGYKSLSRTPALSSEFAVKVSDIELKCQRTGTLELNEIPRIKYSWTSCQEALDDYVYPFWDRSDIFNRIFISIEMSDKRDNPLYRQVQRLCVRLNLYSKCEPKNGFAIQPRDYLKCSLAYGPSFTEWLSKARAAAIVKSLSHKILEENKKFIEEKLSNTYGVLIAKEKYDYDSFLNERFLIDYEEEASDFEWAFKPVESDPEYLSKFRYMCRILLLTHKLEKIRPADSDDFATWISDSITIDNGGPVINRTLMRNKVQKGELLDLISNNGKIRPLLFKRQVVQVDPGNCRDTWQCNLESLFVIKRTSHLLKQILEKIPSSAMCSPEKLHKRKKLLRKAGNFFMFDIKKCGLTVNRELITILADELVNLYPGCGFEELYSYNDITVMNGSTPHRPLRGTGMGNSNECVTLIQCVIGFMVEYQYKVKSLFFNDDGVFYDDRYSERIPFAAILTLFNRLGMIINLEKTIISRFNVFCEDYVTEDDLDYKKLQLYVVPFADVFFKRNIVAAKQTYNSLKRALIGRNLTVDILESIIYYWGYEFHRMEAYLPYEFGGWEYIGRTNVNEVLRFLFDPRIFLLESEPMSYIPYMREWMGFLVNAKSLQELTIKGNRIPYKTFVPNPFKSWETSLGDFPFMEEIYYSLNIELNDSIRRSLDSLYNERGSKNAKPKLKARFYDRMFEKRKEVFRRFRRIRGRYLVLERHPGSLKTALDFLRGEEITPNNYLPPDFMILRTTEVSQSTLRRRGRLLIPAQKKVLGTDSRWATNCLMRSLYLQKIVKGTNIYSLRNQIIRNKERYLLSDTVLMDGYEECHPPPWVYLFLPRREYARLLYISIYNNKMVPTGWEQFPSKSDVFDMAVNPIKYIFPKSFDRFRSLERKAKAYRDHISNCLEKVEIETNEEFNFALDLIEDDIISVMSEDKDIFFRVKEDIEVDPFEAVFTTDEDLAERIIGEKDFNDLLNEFIENEEDLDSSPGFLAEQSYYEEEIADDIEVLSNSNEMSETEIEIPDRNLVLSLYRDEAKSNNGNF